MDTHYNSERLISLLHLRSSPVALAFRSKAPAGIPRIAAPAASGCTYWKLAAEGATFYTESADHLGCPIGAHTHGIAMPAEKKEELEGLVRIMVGLEYLRMEEIPQIPQRKQPFDFAVYAPLGDALFSPDTVLVRGNAKSVMLLAEAAAAAGVPHNAGVMGRPTCAMVPVSAEAKQAGVSVGCIGNRVYTGLADGELYFAIPGAQLAAVVEKLEVIVQANITLETFHRGRMNSQ